ncbi:MAG: hypothetical protein K9G76_12100 [Bacteroidales bacterium]|nr:hypothetical protein [Bacteroidales bacterium]MCF8405270.1 hypothetical protein [Bacteroidales bacterium]
MKRGAITTTLILLIVIINHSLVKGQDKQISNKYLGGFGYFMVGHKSFDLQKMNDAFKANAYPEINNGSVSIGGGGHYLINNWLIGGEGAGLLGNTVENNNYRLVHAGGYGFFNLGYLALRTPSFMLYQVLGIGGGNLTVYIKDKNLLTNSFDDLLENPGRESIIATGGFLLNFSIMANYFISGNRKENNSSGFILGIKGGYVLNTTGNNWQLSGQTLKDSPAAGMSGPYVSIVLGGGGIAKNK